MAGQLIDCPTCKNPLEIPLHSLPTPTLHTGPAVRHAPLVMPPAQRAVLKDHKHGTPSSAPTPSTRFMSPGLVVAFVILTLVCFGLAGGMLYLIKSQNASSGTAQGTPVAPTKENTLIAQQTTEEKPLIEKMLPDVTVDGEVFIVTKGGQSIKLGLVEVALIPMQTLQPYLQELHAVLTNKLSALELQIQTAESEYDRLNKEKDAAFQNVMRQDDYNRMQQANYTYEKARDAASSASDSWLKLTSEQDELMSGSFYFESIPSPLRSTKTNSDGRFRLLVPGSGLYAIAATASRHVGDDVEWYYWLIEIDPKDGASQSIMLSNDNMTSSRDVELLIMMNPQQ